MGIIKATKTNKEVKHYEKIKQKGKTGLYMAIPEGYELQIRSRSGLALKNGIFCLNSPGTIN